MKTHPFFRPFEMSSKYSVRSIGTSFNRSLIDQSLKICTRESNSTSRNDRYIYFLPVVTNVSEVVSENLHSTSNVGEGDDYVSIESTRSDERFVE